MRVFVVSEYCPFPAGRVELLPWAVGPYPQPTTSSVNYQPPVPSVTGCFLCLGPSGRTNDRRPVPSVTNNPFRPSTGCPLDRVAPEEVSNTNTLTFLLAASPVHGGAARPRHSAEQPSSRKYSHNRARPTAISSRRRTGQRTSQRLHSRNRSSKTSPLAFEPQFFRFSFLNSLQAQLEQGGHLRRTVASNLSATCIRFHEIESDWGSVRTDLVRSRKERSLAEERASRRQPHDSTRTRYTSP